MTTTSSAAVDATRGANRLFARATRRRLLLAAYGVVLLGPLALIAGVVKAGAQGRLVVLADVLGFVGLSLLTLQIVVSGRWATTTRSFGLRSVLSLHKPR